MSAHNITNTLLFALSRPSRLAVLLKKAWRRVTDRGGSISPQENLAWITSNCQDFPELARGIDPELWRQAEAVGAGIKERARQLLTDPGLPLGGGGYYPMLYFIARLLRPGCVVETGVAAGFTSQAFLTALSDNGKGKLYSSDFPYFRLPDPEKYIGILVEDRLRNRWELYKEGDARNLPRILAKTALVDLFHYDSDKSYAGRSSAISRVAGKMAPHGIMIMDDIQDNSFFHDYVTRQRLSCWRIFAFEGKYIGVIGRLDSRARQG
jgi:predicted O-methyltransferase YrrM